MEIALKDGKRVRVDADADPDAVRRRRPDETALLESLREQTHTVPIMPDQVDQVAALTTKDEQMAGVPIGFQRFLHHQRKP
jgi:hypothetical protein